ncbi:MAG: ATP-binding cassette domain-containing protein [Croceimicrobium sp.]
MVLQSSNLKFAYSQSASFDFPDIAIQPGEAALLLGPSGSGKSTLLNLLAGLNAPQAGSISINGIDLQSLGERKKELFRAKNIGLVFQRSFFLPYLSLSENLKLASRYQGNKIDNEQIAHLFEQLQIRHLSNKKPNECSLGEQQRASIARALIQNPSLILADEPSSALDDYNASKVADLLLSVCQKFDSALLVVTHDQRLKSLITKSYSL